MSSVVLSLLALTVCVSSAHSLGLYPSTSLSELCSGHVGSHFARLEYNLMMRMKGLNSETEFSMGTNRRRMFGVVLVVVTTGATPSMRTTVAQAESTIATTVNRKNNYNYELGNDECQTAYVRNREIGPLKSSKQSTSNGSNNNNGDCIDDCERIGQRYCHKTTASNFSPTLVDGRTSKFIETTKEQKLVSSNGLTYNANRGGAWRDTISNQYVETTKEPKIVSSKPIPGLQYNSSRGGAWRDTVSSQYVETTKEPKITSSKPIPGLQYNSNRGGAWRD